MAGVFGTLLMRGLIIVLGFLLIALQYPLWFGESSLPEAWKLQSRIDQQKEENAQLVDRNKVLESEVYDLKHGLAVVEEKARNELGMIKPDETYYQIVETPVKEE